MVIVANHPRLLKKIACTICGHAGNIEVLFVTTNLPDFRKRLQSSMVVASLGTVNIAVGGTANVTRIVKVGSQGSTTQAASLFGLRLNPGLTPNHRQPCLLRRQRMGEERTEMEAPQSDGKTDFQQWRSFRWCIIGIVVFCFD